MDVGVRELKQHLSEYLERAAGGEVIRVTDRGRPKAVLGPLLGTGDLDRGVEEGWISLGADPGPLPSVVPMSGRRRIVDALDEDRGE